MRRLLSFAWLVCTVAAAPLTPATAASPPTGAQHLGLVINQNDPLSERIGAYYQQQRHVPAANVVRVRLPTTGAISRAELDAARADVNRKLPADVQFLALAWALPYRAGCMSITSAFAMGYDEAACVEGCKPTPASKLFDANTRAPWTDLKIRPAMALAATTFEDAKALIDRGVASDGTRPGGSAYLVSTTDPNRNVRAAQYPFAARQARAGVRVQGVAGDLLYDKHDVLFYFTGLTYVVGLRTNTYLPGAVADHLTSAGGVLDGTGQMSAIEWLRGGATGSYGAVVEPCNFPGKFPSPPIVMKRYLAGETLIEAYWKSVQMPAQGVFIGEPLAAPWR